jgi:hypothetical protein
MVTGRPFAALVTYKRPPRATSGSLPLVRPSFVVDPSAPGPYWTVLSFTRSNAPRFSEALATMVYFSKLGVVAAAVSGAYAAPWPISSKHSTHRTRKLARGIEVSTYHPKNTFETYQGQFLIISYPC